MCSGPDRALMCSAQLFFEFANSTHKSYHHRNQTTNALQQSERPSMAPPHEIAIFFYQPRLELHKGILSLPKIIWRFMINGLDTIAPSVAYFQINFPSRDSMA